jgi:hypothetical protein
MEMVNEPEKRTDVPIAHQGATEKNTQDFAIRTTVYSC